MPTLYWATADGGGPVEPLLAGENPKWPFSFTPDGQTFVMIRVEREGTRQINIVLNWFDELQRLVPVS